MALLIVVSILTVIGIMGVAFAFSMYLETQATRQFVSTTQARYLAEAGINHARALLDEDRLGSRDDDLMEPWAQDPVGHDVEIEGSGSPNARWWPVTDSDQQPTGRYAFQVADEGGKANLNVALADPSPLTLGAINLTKLLQAAGLDQARALTAAKAIERYRYGGQPGGSEVVGPGIDGVDDDHNGVIDDLSEYDPLALRGNDRRIDALEDLATIAGLSPDEIRRLSHVATVYSWGLNVSATGKTRVNVNSATANELVPVLLEAGVKDPWQAAVNIADYVDSDLEMSRVTKSSQLLAMPNQGAIGAWSWRDTPIGHYASDGPGADALSWSVAVPTGRFRILARGLSGKKAGDMTVAGQLHPSVEDGESLGMFDLNGTLSLKVVNHEPAGTPCAFLGIELVAESAQSGVVVRGVEAIRFNELMIEPTITLKAPPAFEASAGSSWTCPVGSDVCTNSGTGQGHWTWTILQPGKYAETGGRYYLRVFGAGPGQTVGDVRIDGTLQRLTHGQRHPVPLFVGADGKVSLTLGKTDPQQTYYLKEITLSLQPDAEYVELINLSDRDLDLSGWTIEGELTGGRQGRLPAKSIIKAHGLLVAVVDLDDQQLGLDGNGIDARAAWGIAAEANVVQLEFPGGAPSPDEDWLKATLPSGTVPRLILRSHTGSTVDEVQYPLPPKTTAPLQSLEKGDPTVIVDRNNDGIDDGWYPSLKLYTPGLENNNDGMTEHVGLETKTHHPNKEITILNRPLGGVGELAGLPSGEAWKPFSSEDLSKIVDRLTVEGNRLEAAGHVVDAGGAADAWEEKADGYYLHTDPRRADAAGRWRWTDVPNGTYRLSLYGCQDCAGEQLSVRWQRQDASMTEWSPSLTTDAQGRVSIGQIAIGMDGGTALNTLTLEVLCGSPSGICHVAYVRLDPRLIRVGPVNVNTAPRDVLLALPGMTDALASRIVTGRPYGDQGGKGRGIGDVLVGDILGADEESKLTVFRQLAHLLTTRSDVFQVVSLGQATEHDRATATQKIRAVIQR